MPKAEATVEIDAPIDLVWQVMTDVARYSEWNPFIVSVGHDGPPRVGSMLALDVRWPQGGGARAVEKVTRFDPPTLFEYVFTGPLATLGLVRATRVQSLERTPEGRTRYTTCDEFRGPLAFAIPLKKVQAGFDAQAKALKSRAESLAR